MVGVVIFGASSMPSYYYRIFIAQRVPKRQQPISTTGNSKTIGICSVLDLEVVEIQHCPAGYCRHLVLPSLLSRLLLNTSNVNDLDQGSYKCTSVDPRKCYNQKCSLYNILLSVLLGYA
jgi:hypothetical protein